MRKSLSLALSIAAYGLALLTLTTAVWLGYGLAQSMGLVPWR